MTGGVYIHIPFCRRKCDYCSFYSVPADRSGPGGIVPETYVAKLCQEIGERLPAAGFDSADTVYFGGGTPSLLTAEQVNRILRVVRNNTILDAGAEVTIEMNPGDVSADLCTRYRDAGVTRAVLGVQTLSKRLHGLIGRSADCCTDRVLDEFFSVPGLISCLDLITGIPSQTPGELCRDIDRVASYRPAHISAYLLSIEKNTPLFSRLRLGPETEPEQAALFELAMTRLGGLGYEHYEISNYALPGYESRHNMKYWRFDTYIGFGPGAHSFVNGERYINAMTIGDYMAAERPLLDHDIRTTQSAAVEYLMTGLRLLGGLSLREMEERLDWRIPAEVLERINAAVEKGMMTAALRDGGMAITLSHEGVFLADRVIYGIVEPLLQ